MLSVVSSDCTSPRQNAHVTERRVVLYRWHPWYQQAVHIIGVSAKTVMPIYRCRAQESGSRSLEVPQWMFDAATCCRVVLAVSPMVTCAALRSLRALMAAAEAPVTGTMIKAEHLIPEDSGGARALQEQSRSESPDGAVSGAYRGAVDGSTCRGPQSHDSTAGPTASPPCPEAPRSRGER